MYAYVCVYMYMYAYVYFNFMCVCTQCCCYLTIPYAPPPVFAADSVSVCYGVCGDPTSETALR